MASIEEFKSLKAKVTKLDRLAAEKRGAKEEALKQLKERFGCSTLKEAEELLKKLEKTRDNGQKIFDRQMKEYKEKWAHVLGEV